MAKLNWIEKSKDKVQQLVELLRFFAVASLLRDGKQYGLGNGLKTRYEWVK